MKLKSKEQEIYRISKNKLKCQRNNDIFRSECRRMKPSDGLMIARSVPEFED